MSGKLQDMPLRQLCDVYTATVEAVGRHSQSARAIQRAIDKKVVDKVEGTGRMSDHWMKKLLGREPTHEERLKALEQHCFSGDSRDEDTDKDRRSGRIRRVRTQGRRTGIVDRRKEEKS